MRHTSIADLLDQCIDALLAGRDWQALTPPGHPARSEVAALMRVAEELRRTRPAGWQAPGGAPDAAGLPPTGRRRVVARPRVAPSRDPWPR